MARGNESKSVFYNKILEVFPNSFMYNGSKEIRVPFIEDGVEIQLKIVATCAKVNVDRGSDTVLPGTTQNKTPIIGSVSKATMGSISNATDSSLVEPTEEEKMNVKALMEKLGL